MFFNDLGGGKGNAKQGKNKHSLPPPCFYTEKKSDGGKSPNANIHGDGRGFFSLRDGREGGGGSLKEMLILYFFPGTFCCSLPSLPPPSPPDEFLSLNVICGELNKIKITEL